MRSAAAVVATILLAASVVAARQTTATRSETPKLWAAQTGPKDITLVWTRVARAMQYRIYESTNGAEPKRIGFTTSSGDQYVRPVSAFGVTHQYSLEMIFDDGSTSALLPFNPVIPREATPGPVAPPGAVRAAASGNGVVSITWDAVPGVTAYRIARQIVPGGVEILCRLCPTEPTHVDAAARDGARHIYQVTAVTPSGVSRPTRSNEVVAVGKPSAVPAPVVETKPPVGTIRVAPVPNGCLSLGEQGNLLVRLAGGSVSIRERAQFGRFTTFVPNPEFRTVPGIERAVSVALEGRHALVLTDDGTIRAWGSNSRGQLGIRSLIDVSVDAPVTVRDITNAVAIARGSEHSLALLADGTIRVWGSGARGIPGGRADVTTNRLVPALVPNLPAAKAIAAGAMTNFALLADGTVRGWGGNWGGLSFFGVLGAGPERIAESATPLPVVGVSNAVAITTSGGASLALLRDGSVMAWGVSRQPTRGEPESYLATSSARPVPGIRGAVALSPYLILLADGSVREIWRPEEPVAGIKDAVAVASDPTNRYALLADGRLVGWGQKQFWPKGMVTVASFGADTARECSARSK